MKAVVFPQPGSISVESVDDPACGSDEVVIRVASSGICGTDIHIFRNEYESEFPLIPGHEFGGEIVEVGKDVTDMAIGDRAVVDPNVYCTRCDYCRNHQANHCANWQGIGITRGGGFAEYVNVPARAAYTVRADFSDAQLAFVEPLACVIWALRRIQVKPADRVLIFGCGPMGLLLLQALQRSGAADITMVDKQVARVDLAQRLGASHTVLASKTQSEQLQAIAPQSFDVIVDATGIPAVIEKAFAHLKARGQFLQFGVTPMDAKISISPYDIFRNDWQIVGSFALCYTTLPAIRWLETNTIDVEPLISHRLPLSDFESGFDSFLAGDTLKVHLTIGD